MTSLCDVEPVTRELSGRVRPKRIHDNQGRVPVHVHVMAAKVERDKELEDERMLWICRGEITEQAARGCPVIVSIIWTVKTIRTRGRRMGRKGWKREADVPISDHIEDSAEL